MRDYASWQKEQLRYQNSLSGLERVGWNLRRLVTPKSLRHTLDFPPKFLSPVGDQGDQWDIRWKGKVINQTFPLQSLRGAVTGDCYIIATGPCASALKPDLISGQTLVGVNGSFAIIDKLNVLPDYFVISDEKIAAKRFKYVRPMLEKGIKLLCTPHVLFQLCKQDSALVAKVPIGLIFRVNRKYGVPKLDRQAYESWARNHPDMHLHPNDDIDNARIGFSTDLAAGIYIRGTVTMLALQSVVFMGAKRIFIWGMNMDYSMKKAHAYDEEGQFPGQHDKPVAEIYAPAYEVARDVCRSRGVEVYNVCPESLMPDDIIPKISADQVRQMISSES